MKIYFWYLWLTLAVINVSCTHAEITNSSLLTLHGRFIVAECTVNSGENPQVNFGDSLGINRIDGNNYEQSVPFTVDCSNSLAPLTLTLSGTQTDFDEAAVATTTDGLGIELRMNGEPLPLFKPVNISYEDPPQLTAVPVAESSKKLSEGAFSGTVKLIVEVP